MMSTFRALFAITLFNVGVALSMAAVFGLIQDEYWIVGFTAMTVALVLGEK